MTRARPGVKVLLPADFRAFHATHRQRYHAYAYTQLGSHADAEEAVDITFEQLALDWKNVLGQPNAPAYAWKVLKHRVIDALRARDRRPALVDWATFETAAIQQATDPVAELETTLALTQAIAALPERQRDVMVLCCVLGYTTTEAASTMGVSDATVRSHRRHATRRLAADLGYHAPTPREET